MSRLVLAPAIEIVTIGAGDLHAEVPLLLQVILEMEERIVDRAAAFLNGAHQGDLARAQLVEDGLDLSGLQAGFEVVEHRVVAVVVGSKEVGVLAPQVEDLLEVRSE